LATSLGWPTDGTGVLNESKAVTFKRETNEDYVLVLSLVSRMCPKCVDGTRVLQTFIFTERVRLFCVKKVLTSRFHVSQYSWGYIATASVKARVEGRQAIPRFAPGTLLNQCQLHKNKETHTVIFTPPQNLLFWASLFRALCLFRNL
jgi:hypothetical protein